MCTKEGKMNYKFDGSKVYFTSDTHFYHSNIIGFCKRPFKNVEDMNETLIENWNRVVSQDDIVFHLGNFCLGGSHEWTKILNRLNGKIYLILGNHDLKNIRQGYTSKLELTTMQMHIEIDKQKIDLNHCPFLCYGGAYGNTWQLFGHVHTSKYNTGKDALRLDMIFPMQYDVGVDNNDSRIDAWIYGHSHTNIDTEIGNTKVISNQMGYVFENEHVINGFDPGEFLTI